jgi:hypothetical protein
MADLPHAMSAYAVFDTVDSWLAERATPTNGVAGPGASSAPPILDRKMAAIPPTPPQSAHRKATMNESPQVVLSGGELVRETPIAISDPFGDPLGILTEPLGETAGICAVWLNAGPQRRIGPNRMWVEAARRWAAQGVPTFRVDLAGIGDAGGDSSSLREVRSFFVPDYFKQIRRVLDTLQAHGLPDRFLLGGLCAGGYWALQVAQHDSRVSAAAALNPGYLVYDGGVAKATDQVRALGPRLLERSTWSRVVRGQITPSAHLRVMRTLLAGLGRTLPSRVMKHPNASNEVERVFQSLCESDQRALIMFAGEERLYARLLRTGRLAGLERWPNISVEHITVASNVHTLRPLHLQQEAHRLVDELLQRELELMQGAAHAQRASVAGKL